MRKNEFIGFMLGLVGLLLAMVLLSFSSTGLDEWNLRIGVKKADSQYCDSYNFIGSSRESSLYYDAKDVPEPPTSPSRLSLYFPHYDWGIYSGKYASDLRPPIVDTDTYEFVVEADEYAQLTLFWQDIKDVSENYQLTLLDEEREIFIDMRTVNDYTFDYRPGLKKTFRVIVRHTIKNMTKFRKHGLNS